MVLPRPIRTALPAVVAVVPVVAMLVQQLGNLGDDGFPEADWAVLELATRNALVGRQLTGAYSRWGFNHPGPAMFYWLAPFYRAVGERFSGLTIGTLVFQALTLGAVVAVAGRTFGRRAAWVAAGVVAVFAWRFGIERFRDPWNPYWVVAPLALLMVCAMAAWKEPRRWPLALAVAAASVAVQSHLGAAALSATGLALALAGTIWAWCPIAEPGGTAGATGEPPETGADGEPPPDAESGRPAAATVWTTARNWTRIVAPAVVVGAVLWVLPGLQQVTGDPGNFAELYAYARSNDSSHSLSEVGPIVVSGVAWAPTSLGFAFGPASPFVDPLRAHTYEYAFVVASGLLLVGGAVVALRRGWGTPWVLVGAVPVGAAAVQTVASLTIRDDVLPYLFTPVLAVALVWWLGGALYVGRAVAELARIPADWQRRLVPAAAGVAVLAALAGSGRQFDEGTHAAGERWERPGTDELVDEVERYCDDDRPVWIEGADTWVISVPLGVALARCGVDVSFEDDMAYMVGDRYAREDPPRGAVRLCVGPDGQLRCDA